MLRLTQYTGRAGELLVAFDFTVRGYSVLQAPMHDSPYDLLVDCGADLWIRVQVKTTAGPRCRLVKGRERARADRQRTDRRAAKTRSDGYAAERKRKYTFSLGGENSVVGRYESASIDLFAFVVLDTREVLYVSWGEVANGSRYSQKEFGCQTFAERAKGSLDRFLFERILLS